MKILLVGNQNSGKTTLFNYLTNSKEKIGNWPGVTIKKKEGKINNTNHTLVDLPGIYSLSSYSIEEKISINYLLNEQYDLIINIMDFNYIKRSLYLTTELLELDKKIIILLTHTKNYNKKELLKNIKNLENELCTKIITIEELKKNYNLLFKNIIKQKKIMINNTLDKNQKIDVLEFVSLKRYNYINTITRNIKIKSKNNILDKLLLNKVIGIPIFIMIMLFIYYLSIGIVGKHITEIVNGILNSINKNLVIILNNLKVSNWLISLIINCFINGLGILLNFIPQLFLLFIFTELLSQTGYIIRITYLLEGLFNKIGLSGRSIIPFIIGTDCSVQGIIQTRIIEDKIKREKTILLTPFIPCTAKLPIIIIISNFLFNNNYFIIIIYLYSILVIIILSLILKKIYISKENTFIMELPPLKFPNLKYLVQESLNKIIEFIKRTSSIILISSIIIWFFLSFSIKLQYNPNIENSILAHIGKKVSFLFYPFLGNNNWKLSISILQGIIGREQIISSLNIITNNNIQILFTPVSAFSFLTFNLFSIPCINTIITMKQELKSIKKLLLYLLFQFLVALLLSTLTYQLGNLLW